MFSLSVILKIVIYAIFSVDAQLSILLRSNFQPLSVFVPGILPVSASSSILLKTPIRSFDGEILKDPSQMKQKDREGLSEDQLMEKAPSLTLGFLMATMVSSHIQPKDGMESAKFQRLARKFHNKLITAKGEWIVTKEELKDLIETLQNVKGGLATPKYLGSVIEILEDLLYDAEKQDYQNEVKKN